MKFDNIEKSIIQQNLRNNDSNIITEYEKDSILSTSKVTESNLENRVLKNGTEMEFESKILQSSMKNQPSQLKLQKRTESRVDIYAD